MPLKGPISEDWTFLVNLVVRHQKVHLGRLDLSSQAEYTGLRKINALERNDEPKNHGRRR